MVNNHIEIYTGKISKNYDNVYKNRKTVCFSRPKGSKIFNDESSLKKESH